MCHPRSLAPWRETSAQLNRFADQADSLRLHRLIGHSCAQSPLRHVVTAGTDSDGSAACPLVAPLPVVRGRGGTTIPAGRQR